MRSREVRVQLNRVSSLFVCAGVVTCLVVAECHPCADHEIKWIEFQCWAGFGKCLVMTPLDGKIVSVPVVRVCVLRIQLQSTPELDLRSGPIPTMAKHKAQGGVGFRPLLIDLDRFASGRQSLRECVGRGFEPVPRKSAVAVGQPGICRGVGGIAVNGLLKIMLCLLHAFGGSLVPVVATFQIGLVCFRPGVPRICQACFLLFGESDVYLAGDALHNGVLHSEQIFEFAVVTFGPEVRLILCLDELNGDAYTVRPATNAALDKIVRVQFFADLLRSQMCAFVLCNRTAGYHGESIPIQLSYLGDHFFSQAFTEELLLGIATQVLERQDSEDYLALGMCGRVRCPSPAPNDQE